jgi:hypothetical protein
MPHWNNQPWQRNLSKIASGKPGAVQSQMKALEEENRRLKRMYAELSMQADLLKEALGKK